MTSNGVHAIPAIKEMLDVNNRLFHSSLAGISEEEAKKRIGGDTNSMNFLAGHVAVARYLMAMLSGLQVPPTLSDEYKSYNADANYDSIADLIRSWDDISARLVPALDSLSEEQLQAAPPQPFPIGNQTILNALGFLVEHESYHIGQMGFVRRALGHSAAAYQ